MLPIVTVVFLIFVLSAFINDSTIVALGVLIVMVGTVLTYQYDCQLVVASGSGVCSSVSSLISDMSQNAAYTLGLWIFAYPVKGVIKSFVPRLG